MEVELNDIPVLYVTAVDGTNGAADAFKQIRDIVHWNWEDKRKAYGTVFEGEYRACVTLEEGDNPEELGLKTWTIPGGTYVKDTILDWENHIQDIGPKCMEIIKNVNFDETRPVIEFYQSESELKLLIPIK